MMLREEEVDYDVIRQTKIFHFGTLSMTDEPVRSATKKALEVAKEAGCLISLDPNLRPPLWKSLDEAKKMMEYGFRYCDILKISDNEIQFVDGLSAAAEAEGGWAADPPIGRRGAAGRPGSMTSSRSWDGRSAGGTGRNS